MLYRLGIFLIFVGLLLAIFTLIVLEMDSNPLPVGGAALFSLVIGFFLSFRFRPQYSPTGRFRSINKFRGKITQKNE